MLWLTSNNRFHVTHSIYVYTSGPKATAQSLWMTRGKTYYLYKGNKEFADAIVLTKIYLNPFFFNSCFHCHDYHLKGECQKMFEECCCTQKITYLLGRIHTCVMRNLVSLSGNLPFSLERIISSMSPCSFSITTNTFSGVSNIHSRFTMPRWRKLWERGGSEQEEKGRRRRNRMIWKLFWQSRLNRVRNRNRIPDEDRNRKSQPKTETTGGEYETQQGTENWLLRVLQNAIKCSFRTPVYHSFIWVRAGSFFKTYFTWNLGNVNEPFKYKRLSESLSSWWGTF